MLAYHNNYCNHSIAEQAENQNTFKLLPTDFFNSKSKFDPTTVVNDTFDFEKIYIDISDEREERDNNITRMKTKDFLLNDDDDYLVEKYCHDGENDKTDGLTLDIKDITPMKTKNFLINDDDDYLGEKDFYDGENDMTDGLTLDIKDEHVINLDGRHGLENSRLNIYLNSNNMKKNRQKTKPKKSKKKKKKNILFHDLPIEEKSNLVALDCEMVGVGPYGHTSALARVCLISWNRSILLDTYVKIEEPVTDYRTYISGIEPSDIHHGLPLDLVRKLVLGMIQDKTLIGHGLKCDLKALGITHPWYRIRDTTKFPAYTHIKGEPQKKPQARKLRDLAKEHLNIIIQDGNHCPIEDATAALELYKINYRKWENLVKYNTRKTNRLLNGTKK